MVEAPTDDSVEKDVNRHDNGKPQGNTGETSEVKAGKQPDTGGVQEVDEFGLPVRNFRKPALEGDSESEAGLDEEHHQLPLRTIEPEYAVTNGVISKNAGSKADPPPEEERKRISTSGAKTRFDEGTLETNPAPQVENVKDLPHSPAGARASPRASMEKQSSLPESPHSRRVSRRVASVDHPNTHAPVAGASEWSHQQQVVQQDDDEEDEEEEEMWKDMPAFARYNLYDDDGRLVAHEKEDSDEEEAAYGGLGGAGKGYTKINLDEDAQSATSMDENTKYLFKEAGTDVVDEDEEARDPLAQMEATKDLLTEGQRIAYVGVTRVAMVEMIKELEDIEGTKGTKKELSVAQENIKMWSQKMMIRLYGHMDIDAAEQLMIEQLSEHGVQAEDLTPTLMQNARVKNPLNVDQPPQSPRPSIDEQSKERRDTMSSPSHSIETLPPPPYSETEQPEAPEIQSPSEMPKTKNIDIDLRWTVLCDLFLLLIADSVYDSRSRRLLERVGSFLNIPWLEICKFEKRVTEALEMQEEAAKETWNEDEHMETRRKMAIKRRMMMMGLATVGGGLVIGLSAGLLAPVIGAGLAAGFTTIGVAGTGSFLAGAGGAAVIATTGVLTGGTIGVRASSRRFGAVKTFEYRPLHNNKRVNLIVTVSGWMNGKVDDVRLPFSTVEPVMGDMYSVLWEPEMLQSMGQTINILATEALTQGLQQVLGSTVLVALMASLQLPIVLTKLSYLIDNPWTVSLDRANSAGLILADSLIDRNLGVRPVTLVGFSLGARVIFSCLKELANKGAFGIVQNVYLFGSPIVAKKDEYLRARMVISGRFVNGYATNDWILGYLFRATSGGIMRVAGLAPVEEIPGLENIDLTSLVNGHMAYRAAMPRLLREVGWLVDSDEFTEIEDPDPENHQQRQREIIKEIDDARKELEKKPEKKKFGFFGRNRKLAEKKNWETYDDVEKPTGGETVYPGGVGPNVLFDVDAIRAELASEQIEVKQLESTLPPMRLDLNSSTSTSPYDPIHSTKSYDKDAGIRPKMNSSMSSPALGSGALQQVRQSSSREAGAYQRSSTSLTESEGESSPSSVAGRGSKEDVTQSHKSPLSNIQANDDLESSQHPRASSLPPSNPNGSRSRNDWDYDEDEDLGKERQVTMSFE
ncbi:MAG: hypothetical protein M4579_002806 [Chaenotheca gracillima]|nr:MAG: hypothetical protein M4579_002806 [Chaenotheca gracillima]